MDPGCLFVESPPSHLNEGRGSEEKGGVSMEGCAWGVYSSVEQIDALLSYLDPSGKAEHQLKKQVQKLKATMEKASKAAAKLKVDAKEIDLTDEGLVGGGLVGGVGKAALLNKEGPQGKNHGPAILTLSDQFQPLIDQDGAVKDERRKSAAEELKQEILALYRSLSSSECFSEYWGSESRQAEWIALVTRAISPQELSASLTLLEGMISEGCLKPYYPVLFCSLQQDPDHAGTFAATWYRLRALQGALKKPQVGYGARSRGQQQQGGGGSQGGGSSFGLEPSPAARDCL